MARVVDPGFNEILTRAQSAHELQSQLTGHESDRDLTNQTVGGKVLASYLGLEREMPQLSIHRDRSFIFARVKIRIPTGYVQLQTGLSESYYTARPELTLVSWFDQDGGITRPAEYPVWQTIAHGHAVADLALNSIETAYKNREKAIEYGSAVDYFGESFKL